MTSLGSFETSEAEDVLGSLRHMNLCLEKALADKHAWKWAILSLFHALQGAMVCHCSGPSNIEALKSKSAKRITEWLNSSEDSRGKFPSEELAGPDTLIKNGLGANSLN